MSYRTMIGALAALTLSATAASADTAMQEALDNGAELLKSDEIASMFTGKTATFVSASGDKKVLVHYGTDNSIHGKMVGGDWQGEGFYGVANDDQICLSWEGRDAGRLRCLNVLVIHGVAHKFRADGSLMGRIVAWEDGRAF